MDGETRIWTMINGSGLGLTSKRSYRHEVWEAVNRRILMGDRSGRTYGQAYEQTNGQRKIYAQTSERREEHTGGQNTKGMNHVTDGIIIGIQINQRQNGATDRGTSIDIMIRRGCEKGSKEEDEEKGMERGTGGE